MTSPVEGDARIAVVLFNLGGPDGPEAVRPFLFNLFNDPAIIGAPAPIRWLIAQLISRRRAPIAREIYAQIGGKSPIGPETRQQAVALEACLAQQGFANTKCFIAMRYWHPFIEETFKEVKLYNPDHIVLLPLYPQYSTTTTESSLKSFYSICGNIRSNIHEICCYPENIGFVSAECSLISQIISEEFGNNTGIAPKILFSAHGLPKKIVDRGDPYPHQVMLTVQAVIGELAETIDAFGIEWEICYQSRVGPLEWIGPSTEECLMAAGAEKRPVIVVPIAFVSEHSETLVELDIEYRDLAEEVGVPQYVRVPAVGIRNQFIDGLAQLCVTALAHDKYCGVGGAGTSCFDRIRAA